MCGELKLIFFFLELVWLYFSVGNEFIVYNYFLGVNSIYKVVFNEIRIVKWKKGDIYIII